MSAECRLRHNAFVYESDDEYVRRSVAFVRDGLEAGEGCVVANTRDAMGMVRDALGPDARRVTFFDVSAAYTRPAQAVATYYGAFLEQLRMAPVVRAVADFQCGPTRDEWREWAGYEAITNLAYAHLPVWVVCTYDANALPGPLLDSMWETHAEVLDDGCRPSERYADPRALVRRLTPEPEPLPWLRSFPGPAGLEPFREMLARELAAEHVPAGNALGMLVAGTELADNAVRHGGGIVEVRAGRSDGRFVCEVIDRGAGFDDPVAGYLAPRNGVGSGLWVARQLAWSLESFQSPRGFTVRLWF
jgi:anti-sigma regulatory factor (Ser/Thr protein kinase)